MHLISLFHFTRFVMSTTSTVACRTLLRNITINDQLQPIITEYAATEVRDKLLQEVKLDDKHVAQCFACMITDSEFASLNLPILRCAVFCKDDVATAPRQVFRIWYHLNLPIEKEGKRYYSYDLYADGRVHHTLNTSTTPAQQKGALEFMLDAAKTRLAVKVDAHITAEKPKPTTTPSAAV